MPDFQQQLWDAIVKEMKRRLFDESLERLYKCLRELSTEEIWYKPNANSNSVGNLVLHLCGNARQWLMSGLCQQEDIRNRQAEFDDAAALPKDQLIELLHQLKTDITQCIDQLTPEVLLENRPVQTFQENGLSIIIHVIEHFSYHVGQITYFTKLRKDINLGYYQGISLQ